VGAATLLAIALYSRHRRLRRRPGAADQVFLLKYFLSSQSAILWMCVLFFMSTVFYWIGLFVRPPATTPRSAGLAAGLGRRGHGPGGHAGALVREPPDRPDIGHIPVSNLYEVFVLFCWMTALFYLYYEQHYRTRALGAS
jgi:ABC-type transport system involved in cytochrome c biogenesis permease subunit